MSSSRSLNCPPPLSLHRNNQKHRATPLFALAVLSLFYLSLSLPASAQNTVNITSPVTGDVYGNGSGTNNTVPPATNTPDAIENTVNINGNGSVTGDVYGGLADIATHSAAATAQGNSVNLSGSNASVTGTNIYGGRADSSSGAGTSSGNSVIVNNATAVSIEGGRVQSSNGTATVSGNIVEISNGAIVANVEGGHALNLDTGGMVTAQGNSVTVNNATVDIVDGGSAGSGVGNGSFQIFGKTATASGNSVNISDSHISGSVYGGQAATYGSGVSVDAVNNKVVISNGKIDENIYGGFSYIGRYPGGTETGSATGNGVTLNGTPVLNGSLYGGFVGHFVSSVITPQSGDAFSGNTLNLHTSGLTVANVYNFENLNFYLPSSFAANQTVLTVTGTANLTDGGENVVGSRSSIVNVGIDGATSPLKEGDTVTLISATTLVTNGLNDTADGQGMQGVTLKYEFDITTNSNRLIATVTKVGLTNRRNHSPKRVSPNSLSPIKGLI